MILPMLLYTYSNIGKVEIECRLCEIEFRLCGIEFR